MHFRSMHAAMLSLFRVATLEDWTDIMYLNMYGCGHTSYGYPALSRQYAAALRAARGTGAGGGSGSSEVGAAVAPYGLHHRYPCAETVVPSFSRGKKVATALYFVVFVMLTGLVLLSLFVGVVTAGMEMANDRFEEEAKAR
jgi:hypothetical protein